MSKKLEGKIALVTGGSRGIGAAIAKLSADYQDKEDGDIAASFTSEVRSLELNSQHSRTSLISQLRH